ncbi:hypothetical protein FisN_16Lh288 [Fistulifera solaris]|uniref:Pentacotripeptide-repeat region of PRORP domain-containing protein n=1 Tax=Fistulifera solaris TaxID=1519565 RepID=A0A1Z5KP05_FISSO|nr:hypothetical protein FisN_16Lh288 [Fistulifera solaris]|eukprot:GAX28009.1 hypothetical protein FisN_16Lh288 [Fistulifera solaris]
MMNRVSRTAWKLSAAAQLQRRITSPSFSTIPSLFRAKELETPPPLEFSVTAPQIENIKDFLYKAKLSSEWNHGQEGKRNDTTLWDPSFCRSVIHQYDQYLLNLPKHADVLLSAETVILMLKTVVKSRYETPELAQKIRHWEKIFGQWNKTPLTDHVTLRLLTANAKAGNVGRVLKLLQLRLQKKFPCRRRELIYAIQSLRVHEELEDPTRWLDAILVHMHQRKIPLDTELANHMLRTFIGPKSDDHYFYQIRKDAKTIKLHKNAPPHYRGKSSDFSYPLAAAFSFAESLQQGACGHDPILWNVQTHNALLHACVNRGALSKARTELQNAVALKPLTFSYNLLLQGYARLGDVMSAQELYHELLAKGLQPDAFTVRAVVDGLLNVGDVSGAVSAVGDFFHQHTILPPYTTHLKILEFALSQELVFEAKRYVYFLQSLWGWQPNSYHTEEQIKLVKATQDNDQLKRAALEHLFEYFDVPLTDDDFL